MEQILGPIAEAPHWNSFLSHSNKCIDNESIHMDETCTFDGNVLRNIICEDQSCLKDTATAVCMYMSLSLSRYIGAQLWHN